MLLLQLFAMFHARLSRAPIDAHHVYVVIPLLQKHVDQNELTSTRLFVGLHFFEQIALHSSIDQNSLMHTDVRSVPSRDQA